MHISIDGEVLGKGHSAGGPLYVLLWDPSRYLNGLHTIRVKVEVSTEFIYLPLDTFEYSMGLDLILCLLCV